MMRETLEEVKMYSCGGGGEVKDEGVLMWWWGEDEGREGKMKSAHMVTQRKYSNKR